MCVFYFRYQMFKHNVSCIYTYYSCFRHNLVYIVRKFCVQYVCLFVGRYSIYIYTVFVRLTSVRDCGEARCIEKWVKCYENVCTVCIVM